MEWTKDDRLFAVGVPLVQANGWTLWGGVTGRETGDVDCTSRWKRMKERFQERKQVVVSFPGVSMSSPPFCVNSQFLVGNGIFNDAHKTGQTPASGPLCSGPALPTPAQVSTANPQLQPGQADAERRHWAGAGERTRPPKVAGVAGAVQ